MFSKYSENFAQSTQSIENKVEINNPSTINLVQDVIDYFSILKFSSQFDSDYLML